MCKQDENLCDYKIVYQSNNHKNEYNHEIYYQQNYTCMPIIIKTTTNTSTNWKAAYCEIQKLGKCQNCNIDSMTQQYCRSQRIESLQGLYGSLTSLSWWILHQIWQALLLKRWQGLQIFHTCLKKRYFTMLEQTEIDCIHTLVWIKLT